MRAIAWIRPALVVAAAATMSVAWAEVGKSDTEFMRKAAESGMLEIQASELARDKASSDTVKAFADQMIKDHQAADTELKAIASNKGVELPTELPGAERKKVEALGALEGRNFDRQYAQEIGVRAHNKAVTLFRDAASKAKDPDVKAFATKTLPALEGHLDMARKMAKEVGATGSGKAAAKR